MCIYFKDLVDERKSEEHIFPACIGGIKKLRNDAVSATANEIFKPLEDVFAHQSEVHFSRSFYGPGKRGTNKLNSATTTIIYDKKRNHNELGYIFLGKICTIPQILIEESTGKFTFTMQDTDEDTAKNEANIFFAELSEFDILNQKFVYLPIKIPFSTPDIIIGKNDRKIIVASHCSKNELDLTKIDNILKKLKTVDILNSSTYILENPQIEFKVLVDNTSNRVYAKIAFNCLCYLKGVEFVKNEAFDSFRNWIITGEGHSDNWINEDISATSDIVKLMPENSHWCIFTVVNHKVCAVVCLYGNWTRNFVIGSVPEGEKFPLLGYICDYKNHKEYTVAEYINVLTQANHNRLNY